MAAASPTSAASSSRPWRTGRSRSLGWRRRASSRRAWPANRSARSLRNWVCHWILFRSDILRSHGPWKLPERSPECSPAVELWERYFGPSYELFSHEKYAEVWAVDELDPLVAPDGGESVADVATRFSQVLSSAEMEFHGSAILIVSHGDPLQIFQAVLKETKENPSFLDEVSDLKKRGMMALSVLSQHRKFVLLTGELRRLV